MGEQIRNVVTRLGSGAASGGSCDMRSSSVRTVAGPIPVALARDLDALAKLHEYDATCLAGDLLAAAIEDVISALPGSVREQIRQIKADDASAEIEAHREALSWDSGGT